MRNLSRRSKKQIRYAAMFKHLQELEKPGGVIWLLSEQMLEEDRVAKILFRKPLPSDPDQYPG